MSWLEALSESRPDPHPVPGGNRVTILDGGGQGEGRPGDDFSEHADWRDILEPLGAVLHHEAGQVRYWTRPGKDKRDGYSATTGYADDADRLKVFTPHWPPFADGEVYTKFGAYATLNHRGNHKAAARELAQQGYGRPAGQPDRGTEVAGSGYEAPHPADAADAAVPATAAPAGDDEVPRQDGRAGGRVTVIHAHDRPHGDQDVPWPDAPAGTTKEERSKSSRPAAPAPDGRMYAGLLGEIVWAADPTTEADPVGVYASLQAAVGVAIGPGAYIQVGNTRHPLLIWPLLFGRTGSGRKGDATETGTVFFRRAEPGSGEYTVGGLSSGEGLIERLRDTRDENDGGGTNDKRLLVIEPEFGSVMARSKREGSTLAAVQRQAWDGKALSVLNRQALKASASHVAIIGHITPQEFRIRLAESDMAGGTYNRYLPLYVDRSKRLPIPDGVSWEVVNDLGSKLAESIAGACGAGRISLNREAAELWSDELYDEMTAADEEDHAWTEFMRRAAPYCLRIAALATVLDGRRLVTRSDLTAAGMEVRYGIASAKYVLDRQARDPRLDRLQRAIDAAGESGLTRTEITALFSRNLPAKLLDELLASLLETGQYEKAGGRHAAGLRKRTAGKFFLLSS